MNEPREYQIWSYDWWRPGSCGYTSDRGEAGLYTESEAGDVCIKANQCQPNDQPHEVMVHRDQSFDAAIKEPA